MKIVLMASIAVLLSGCWMPPTASVRPGGEPRVIAAEIEVDPVVDSARVESVNRTDRTVYLSISGAPRRAYRVGRDVRNWNGIHTGDHVRATIKEVLSVYVPPLREGDGTNASAPDPLRSARVLVVDPSYRLLTVQYASGRTETFKVALHTPMKDIEAGDSVTIGAPEVIALRVR